MGGDRTPVPGPRQSGTVLDWKGAFGWIQPSKPMNHPSAKKRGGKVYLGAEDVTEELDGIGCIVNFKVYADKDGLGAADVRQGPAAVTKAMPAKVPATSNAVAAFKAGNLPAKGAAKGAGKAAAAKGPVQTAWQKKGSAPQWQAGGKGAKGDKGGKGGKDNSEEALLSQVLDLLQQKGKGGKKGKVLDLLQKGGKGGKSWGKGGKDGSPGWKAKEGKRTMLHDEPLIGEIIEWKGKWGWLKPQDTIDHPLADKHKGDLYLKQEDVEDEIEGVGSVVQFMLYEDAQGLGACNVKPVE